MMEKAGIIVTAKADWAEVRLIERDALPEAGDQEKGTVLHLVIKARNPVEAKAGDRVRVRFPQNAGKGERGLIFLVPLSGVLAGAVFGGSIVLIGPVKNALEALGGKMFGAVLSRGDNLALGFGLLGLIVSMLLLSIWIKRSRIDETWKAEVVKVVDDGDRSVSATDEN